MVELAPVPVPALAHVHVNEFPGVMETVVAANKSPAWRKAPLLRLIRSEAGGRIRFIGFDLVGCRSRRKRRKKKKRKERKKRIESSGKKMTENGRNMTVLIQSYTIDKQLSHCTASTAVTLLTVTKRYGKQQRHSHTVPAKCITLYLT